MSELRNGKQDGTSQVGAISKAQKYSRNNCWKHLEKIIFFPKKYSLKKVAQCQKTQKEFRICDLVRENLWFGASIDLPLRKIVEQMNKRL